MEHWRGYELPACLCLLTQAGWVGQHTGWWVGWTREGCTRPRASLSGWGTAPCHAAGWRAQPGSALLGWKEKEQGTGPFVQGLIHHWKPLSQAFSWCVVSINTYPCPLAKCSSPHTPYPPSAFKVTAFPTKLLLCGGGESALTRATFVNVLNQVYLVAASCWGEGVCGDDCVPAQQYVLWHCHDWLLGVVICCLLPPLRLEKEFYKELRSAMEVGRIWPLKVGGVFFRFVPLKAAV